MKVSKEFKIGAVVIFAIAAFVWGVSFLKGSNLFSKKFYLYAVYPRIDNLIPANPVQIKGYKIGQISSISLTHRNDTAMILVKMVITEDIKIPKGSVARAVSADLLGSKALEIIFSGQEGFAQSGDTLLAEAEPGMKEYFNKQIAPIQAKAEKLVGSIDSVMTVVSMMLNAKTRSNIDQTFESVRKAILSLEKTAYKFDDLVATGGPKLNVVLTNLGGITSNLNKSEAKINNILSNFSNLSDSLAKSQLRSAIGNADKTLKELNTLVARINEGQGTLGKMARNDSLYNNLNRSSEQLEKLLKDLRMNPRRYVRFSIFGRKDRDKPKD